MTGKGSRREESCRRENTASVISTRFSRPAVPSQLITRIFDVQGETLEKCAAKYNAAGATQCKCFDFNLGSGECRGVNNVSLQATAHGDNAYVRA